ncbi:17078_t:CDS:2, partial [Gigaspora margarita]
MSKGSLEIAKQANLIIQPVRPSLDDLNPAIREFHALVKAKIAKNKLAFVINAVSSLAEEKASRNYLEKAGYYIFLTSLPEKISYRESQNEGKSISEVKYPRLREQAKENYYKIKYMKEIVKIENEISGNSGKLEITVERYVKVGFCDNCLLEVVGRKDLLRPELLVMKDKVLEVDKEINFEKEIFRCKKCAAIFIKDLERGEDGNNVKNPEVLVEVSENLRSLEIDKRTLRKTHRIHQFNTSV